MTERVKRRAIYTALIGNYESFSAPDYSVDEDTDLICFTDSDNVACSGWRVVKVEPRFPNDEVRSARYFKIMGPLLLEDYDESLWLDNTVFLKVAPDAFVDALLMDEDIALPMHSFRESVAAEFDAVNAAGYDDVSRVYEQLFHYAQSHPDVLSERPFWTAIIARRHTKSVKALMAHWWDHVLRYSRRDQLSFNCVLMQSGLSFTGLDIDNHESDFHRWPVETKRNYNKTKKNTAHEAIFSAPVSKLAKLENELGYLRQEVARLNSLSNGSSSIPQDLFRQVLKSLLSSKELKIVQVGVCDGVINDPLYDIIMQFKNNSKIVLVEPQENLIDVIKENYRLHPDASIFNCAIGAPGTLSLYSLDEKYYDVFDRKYLKDAPSYRVPSGFVSSDIEHVRKHLKGNLPSEINLDEAIREIKVPSKDLVSVLSDLSWQSFDVLQVDAEGMDDDVLGCCNLEVFKPSVINFEHMHLPRERKKMLYDMLEGLGYKIFEYSESDSLATTLNLKFD
ncbi:glycosyltransferase domain-containing protein [Marinobacter similis]|uniref:Uncharacterized protein n=1 Tax=Marinobacter similis TaxID=1420916 RepID=W5YLP8_9GAMM|nr:glycosyltransferase domain-containing protein [Marinobacter similis]AHI30142.1 hypothetical protein AU14_12815 [Marinobacter similis]